MQPFILIPAYQPNQRLIDLVNALLNQGLKNIAVVNDGSGEQYLTIFAQLPASVWQIHCERNQGKGSALKIGFKQIHALHPLSTVITVDADGQHLPEDVKNIYLQTLQNPHSYILGARQFDKNVPWRSRFGNTLTKKLFQGLLGLALDDTQTGLRALPVELLTHALDLRANHYEFELECLLLACQHKINILQTPIQTVYIENNQSSHFNPYLDSLRIYSSLFKHWLFNAKLIYNATTLTRR